MQHVIVDTSIYRNDPKRAKLAFRAFTRMCKAKKVKLYVPEYVRREFVSQQKQALEEEVQKIRSAVKSITRRSTDKELVAYAESVAELTEDITSKIEDRANAEFATWIEECRATELKIEPDHGQRVTDDYFKGNAPFSSAKNRLDIPDSFIWQNICDLAKEKAQVHLIVNDGAVFKASSTLGNVIGHLDLDAFIETPESQEALTSATVAVNLDRVKEFLSTKTADLENLLESDITNALVHETVNDPIIPDDNNEGMIFSVWAPEDVEFDFGKIDYYGGSEIGIPFTASVKCELNYAIFKSDYLCLEEGRAAHISISERNDHYFDADEEYMIEVEGIFSIELAAKKLEDENMSDEDVEDALASGDTQVELHETKVAGLAD